MYIYYFKVVSRVAVSLPPGQLDLRQNSCVTACVNLLLPLPPRKTHPQGRTCLGIPRCGNNQRIYALLTHTHTPSGPVLC